MRGRNPKVLGRPQLVQFPLLISILRWVRAAEGAWAFAVLAWLTWLFQLPARPSAWLVFLSGLPLGAALSLLMARRRGEPWIAFVRATADVHAVTALLLASLGVQFASGHGISTDGVVYFSQLRSAFFDHDLDVAREFEVLNQPLRPNHIVPMGPTIFWAPLYALVAVIDWAGRALGAWPAPSDPTTLGLGLPYIRAALVTSFAIGAAGLLVLLQHLRREFGKGLAVATTVLIFGATTLFWYMVYEASMTHAASFGLVAFFVILVTRWVPHALTTRRAILLGLVLGLAFLARPQEALFALFPAWLVLTGPGELRERVMNTWHLARWALVGALPWLLLQSVHTTLLFARERYTVFGQSGYLRLLDSRWVDTLFSSWHGFFSWTPIAYIAVIGTIIYLWRNWRWASCTLALLLVMAWLNGSTADWSAGWAFGGRRFTSLLVMLAPGLAAVLDVSLRRPALLLAPAILVALLWNHWLMVQYTIGLLPKDQPVDFAQMVRQQADVHTRYPYFYPFAFPANVWFAWREGLPVNRYALLAPEPNRSAMDVEFDRRSDRYLLGGWDAPGGDDWGPCWWIGGTPAMLAVPLDLPTDRPITVEITARTRADDPPMRAQMLLEVNGTTIGELTAEPDRPTTTRLTIPPIRGGRPWRRGFNKIAFRYTSVARVDPSDQRPPGSLAQQVGARTWPIAVYRLRISSDQDQ